MVCNVPHLYQFIPPSRPECKAKDDMLFYELQSEPSNGKSEKSLVGFYFVIRRSLKQKSVKFITCETLASIIQNIIMIISLTSYNFLHFFVKLKILFQISLQRPLKKQILPRVITSIC